MESRRGAADLHHRGRLISVGHREARRNTRGRVRRTGSPPPSRCPRRRPARAPATAARRRLQSFAARGQDPHRRRVREDGLDQIGRGVEHVLAVVEHQQPDRPSNAAATDSLTVLAGCWVMPNTAATASGTAAGSVTAASSKTQTPSGNSRRVAPRPLWPDGSCRPRRRRSTSPTDGLRPPLRPRRPLPRARSSWWPEAEGSPASYRAPAAAENPLRRPGARTWNTPTGLATSRNRRGPRSIEIDAAQQTCRRVGDRI